MRGTTVLMVSVLVALASVPAGAAANAQGQVTLTVTVVDTNGQPVSGATLNASWDDGNRMGTTRANGQALVDVPRGATVTIDIQSDTYVRNSPYVVEDASGQSVEITVARQGTATVRVRNTQGELVSNSIVRLWQEGQPVVNTRTNANGVLESPVIERGEYQLVAFKEGYLRNRSTLQVDGDVSRTVVIESDSVTVTFDVTDDHFSPPEAVQSARLDIEDIGTIQTLNSGEATASVPVNSDLDVTVSKANYTEVTRTLRTDEQDTMLNVTIQRTPAISVDPANDRVVIGESTSVTITNEYGNPVSNASVALDGTAVGETDANGQLSVTIETEGEHTVNAQADGLQAEAVIEGVRAATSTAAPTATRTATTTAAPETTSGDGPGFTAGLALVALLVVAGRLRRN